MPTEPEATPAIDYNTPPLAAVTGVVRLRNGDEMCVTRRSDDRFLYAPGLTWHASGRGTLIDSGRHEWDIVSQVSVGPTGPGVYETAVGPVLVVRVDGRWRSQTLLDSFDEFGRSTVNGVRSPMRDLRRRIGDLPVTMTASEARQFAIQMHESAKRIIAEDRERVARELCSREGVVMHGDRDRAIRELVASAATDGGSTGIPNPDPPFLRRDTIAHPGPEPEPPQQSVAPEWYEEASPSYSATEGRRRSGDLPEAEPTPKPAAHWDIEHDDDGNTQQVLRSADREHASLGLKMRNDRPHLWLFVLDPADDGGEYWFPFPETDIAVVKQHACEIAGVEVRPTETAPSIRRDTYRPAPRQGYSADEGRAVMDALMPPQQFPQSRRLSAWEMAAGTLWSARVVAGVDPSQTVVMMADLDGEVSLGFVKGAPDELTVVRREHVYVGKVAVSRDDLRVLFDRASSLAGLDYDADQRDYPSEAEFGAMSRAAAALGETLPDWMMEHARKEGWAK